MRSQGCFCSVPKRKLQKQVCFEFFISFSFMSHSVYSCLGDAVFFLAHLVCHRGMPTTVLDSPSSPSSPSSSSSSSFPSPSASNPTRPPSPLRKGKISDERRVLFWFSWDKEVLQEKVPDVDFQLNPWTLYSLINPPPIEYDVVRVFLFIFSFLSFIINRKQLNFLCNGWTSFHMDILERSQVKE